MAKQQKVKENDLWRQNGYYMITVEFGAEKLGRYIVKADTFGESIQKIVNDELKEYPEAFKLDLPEDIMPAHFCLPNYFECVWNGEIT